MSSLPIDPPRYHHPTGSDPRFMSLTGRGGPWGAGPPLATRGSVNPGSDTPPQRHWGRRERGAPPRRGESELPHGG